MVDTLRADRTGVLAGPHATPRLDALGRSGAAYRRAMAPSSWTLPSMAALFAGTDARRNRHSAREDRPTLAERLSAAGYSTVGWTANPLLTAENGFSRGFDAYEAAPAESTASLLADIHELRAWDAEAMVDRGLDALAGAPSGQPLFLYLHLMDPHVPYDTANGVLAEHEEDWSHSPRTAWLPEPDEAQAALLGGWRHAYDAQIRFVDRALGRFLDRAPALRARPAIVAVTSDHGEGLFSHARDADSTPGEGPLGAGYPDHGEQLYEEALRVPLWLAGPGVPAGHDERRLVAVADLAPTLVALAGADATPAKARLPLRDEDPARELVLGAGTRGWFAVGAARKLVIPFPHRAAAEPALWAVSGGRYEPEREDLRAAEPAASDALHAAWRVWLAADEEPVAAAVDEATAERMAQIGYVR